MEFNSGFKVLTFIRTLPALFAYILV